MLSFRIFGGGETRAIQLVALSLLAGACTDETASAPQLAQDASTAWPPDAATADAQVAPIDAEAASADAALASIRYASAVEPIRNVQQALPATFIPPFEDCREPRAGEAPGNSDGRVCTNVAISGCTEPGRYFPDYGSCEVVRTQRPYWPAAPTNVPPTDDPRLSDESFLRESAWARDQIAASGCTCCHDNRVIAASQWDIALGPLWIDSLSDPGLALFAGLADSSVLGAYPPDENHGFDRERVGVPSTDPPRMSAFALRELMRRGRSEEWARAVPPFGGPIYENSVKPPEPCGTGEGIAPDGSVRWTGGGARYVYVLARGSKNPGVPPNLDLPQGTLWRLDVLASEPPITSGLAFATTPAGSFQTYPPASPAGSLALGETYQLVVLRDVGLPLANCLFEYGKPVADGPDVITSASEAGAGYASDAGLGMDAGASDASAPSSDAAACGLTGGDERGFGAACSDTVQHSDCSCAANYCSKSPFDTQGYCSVTGCKENPSLCPAGWSCLDISMFAPGQPSVCTPPGA